MRQNNRSQLIDQHNAIAQWFNPEIDLFDQHRRAILRPMARFVPAEAVGEVAVIGAGLLPPTSKMFL